MKRFQMAIVSPQNKSLAAEIEICWRRCNPPPSAEWSWVGRTCRSCKPLVPDVQKSLPKSGMPKEEMGLDSSWHLNLSLFLSSDYSFRWTVVVSTPGKRAPLQSKAPWLEIQLSFVPLSHACKTCMQIGESLFPRLVWASEVELLEQCSLG